MWISEIGTQALCLVGVSPIRRWNPHWNPGIQDPKASWGLRKQPAGPKQLYLWWYPDCSPWRRPQQAAAAAAKSLQLCPTLCDPIDGSPPGSAVPGILQARTLEWVAISFSSAWKWKVKVKSLSWVWLFTTPWTAAHQAPPSMGFSRQEYWSGVPLPSPTQEVDQWKYSPFVWLLLSIVDSLYASIPIVSRPLRPAEVSQVNNCRQDGWAPNPMKRVSASKLAGVDSDPELTSLYMKWRQGKWYVRSCSLLIVAAAQLFSGVQLFGL